MRIKNKLKKICLKLLNLRPLKKKVVFISFGGRQYSADPRAISEKLHELHPDFEIVWIIRPEFREGIALPEYVKTVDIKTGLYYEVTNALAFVTTDPFESGIIKRDKQLFIQTWHGDRGFKKCLYEAWPNGKRPREIVDGKVTDVAIAASDYGEDVYRKAFRYYGKVTRVGMPRNDRLINNNPLDIESIKKKLHIPKDTKVLTYAPTYRDSKEFQYSLINIEETLEKLELKTSSTWMCLVRAHASSQGIATDYCENRIVDASNISDMADVLLVSDMLITDYSSCAGDFILTGKPTILALFDVDEYKSYNRDLRVDIEKTGYVIVHNQSELNSVIENYTIQDYKTAAQEVMNFYNVNETGNASEQICNLIFEAYCQIQNS